MIDREKLNEAIQFATDAHRGQYRKGSGDVLPYVTHPIEVMKRLALYGVADIDVLCAAVLHDVIEDTDVTEQGLRLKFGDRITDFVVELTSHDRLPNEEKADYIKRRDVYLASFYNTSVEALVVKVADRLCNSWDYHGDGKAEYAIRYFNQANEVMEAFSKRRSEVSSVFSKRAAQKIQHDIYHFLYFDDDFGVEDNF